MLRYSRCCVAVFAIVVLAPIWLHAADPETSPRQLLLLSDAPWQFAGGDATELPEPATPEFDQLAWATVQVPHVFQTRSEPTQIEQAWYRRKCSIRPQDQGKRLYLRFEGAAAVATVYVNGKKLGEHHGAYTAFIFDATDALHVGDDNDLAVKVDNRAASTKDCLPNGSRLYKVWGGLYRKVWLITTDPLHIDPTDFASPGVYITPANVTADHADLAIRLLLSNKSSAPAHATVRATLLDPAGESVKVFTSDAEVNANATATVELKGSVDRPQLWAPRAPKLYHLQVDVRRDGHVTDAITEPTGFRSVVLTGGKVIINGKPTLLAGADLHQEIESKAAAMSDDDFRQDYDLVMDLGANWMRLPHYPHARFEYDLCDQLGIGVWAENGHSNREAPSPNGERITTEMVKQNFNHPCILVWSVGNEASADSAEAYYPVVKALDPTRSVGVANMKAKNVDFHAANTYPGWYGKGDGFSLNAIDYISETGAGGVVTIHCDYADARHSTDKYEPEEYQQFVAEGLFQKAFRLSEDKLGILTWWTMRDFTDVKYKGKHGKSGWNTKGLLTYAGDRKDVYFLYRCFLRPGVPTVHITSQRYFVRMGNVSNGIKAYSNAKTLTLTLNGEKVSTLQNGAFTQPSGKAVDNVFYWPAPLRTGKNKVLVADDAGNSDSATLYFYGSGGAPEIPDKLALVTSLKMSSSANGAFFMDMPVQAQWPIYYDLDSTADNSFDRLPEAVKDATWIATRNLTKPGQESDLSFTLTRAATVFVMATKGSTPPAFVAGSGFTRVDAGDLVWRDNNLMLVPAELFSHAFPAGANVYLPQADRDQLVMLKE